MVVLRIVRTLGLAIRRPSLLDLDLPQIPRLLDTRIDITIFCFVPLIAASHACLNSSSSALDFAISLFVPFESWIQIEKLNIKKNEEYRWEKEAKIEDKKLCMCQKKKRKRLGW